MRIAGKGNRLLHAGKHRRYFRSSPDDSTFKGRVMRLLGTVTDAVAAPRYSFNATDPDELRYPVTIFVWIRWFTLLLYCTLFADLSISIYLSNYIVIYTLFLALFVALNGYASLPRPVGPCGDFVLDARFSVHWTSSLLRPPLRNRRWVRPHASSSCCTYPALAWFAVFFSSFRLSLAWATLVGCCLCIGEPGRSLRASISRQETRRRAHRQNLRHVSRSWRPLV